MSDNKVSPDQALHDLTLAMIYLTRFKEKGRLRSENQLFRAWKSYDWDTLDKLSEEEFIIDRHGNKSLYLTEVLFVKFCEGRVVTMNAGETRGFQVA